MASAGAAGAGAGVSEAWAGVGGCGGGGRGGPMKPGSGAISLRVMVVGGTGAGGPTGAGVALGAVACWGALGSGGAGGSISASASARRPSGTVTTVPGLGCAPALRLSLATSAARLGEPQNHRATSCHVSALPRGLEPHVWLHPSAVRSSSGNSAPMTSST